MQNFIPSTLRQPIFWLSDRSQGFTPPPPPPGRMLKIFFIFLYLQSGLARLREEESGSRLPLNKQSEKKGEDVCFRKSQDRTREACFLHPLFKLAYSCRNSSSILVHSRGFNFHSGPVTSFVNQFLSPLCGDLSVLFFYSKKFIRTGRLVLLICIPNPREGRHQCRMKPFAGRQVDSRDVEQIYYIPPSFHCSWVISGHQYVIFSPGIICWWSCVDATPGVVSELLSASPGSDFIPSDAGGIHIVNETHMYGWQPSSLLGCLNLFCISVTSMGPMGLMQVDNRNEKESRI